VAGAFRKAGQHLGGLPCEVLDLVESSCAQKVAGSDPAASDGDHRGRSVISAQVMPPLDRAAASGSDCLASSIVTTGMTRPAS